LVKAQIEAERCGDRGRGRGGMGSRLVHSLNSPIPHSESRLKLTHTAESISVLAGNLHESNATPPHCRSSGNRAKKRAHGHHSLASGFSATATYRMYAHVPIAPLPACMSLQKREAKIRHVRRGRRSWMALILAGLLRLDCTTRRWHQGCCC
jgi:hypothetical protein